MAEKPNSAGSHAESDASAESKTAARPGLAKRLLAYKWSMALVAASMMVNVAVIAYVRFQRPAAEQPAPSLEVSLGQYHFESDRAEGSHAAKADFQVHVALLPEMGPKVRKQLTERKFRVQQDIEELLRKAHAGDFEDPALQQLKRQVQEHINETLGVRAIAEVIVTDMKLHREGRGGRPAHSAADSPSSE